MNTSIVTGKCRHCGRAIFGSVWRGHTIEHPACARAYAASERRVTEGSCIVCGKPRHEGTCESEGA